tara:strand:+ start:236 stop:706 length:471 start_codon:yes stop_codon:yes gene_type:complete
MNFLSIIKKMGDINYKLEQRHYQKSNQYKLDKEQGLTAEKRCKVILEKEFGELKFTDKFCYFDYENAKYIIELKSRNCKHDAYPTAMINYPKILKYKEREKEREFIIAFLYTDGLYFWKYDEEEVDRVGTTGRNDRGCIETYEMLYFKHNHLKHIV